MKTLRTILLLAFVFVNLCANAATHLYFDVGQFGASPEVNRQITLQPTTPFVGNIVFLALTDSSGVTWYSNAAVGVYNGVIKAPPGQITFQVSVTSTNLGVINALTNTSVSGVQSVPAGAAAWSITSSDARYARSLSNLNVATLSGGTGVTIVNGANAVLGGGTTIIISNLPLSAVYNLTNSLTYLTNLASSGDSLWESNDNGIQSDTYNPMFYNTNGGNLGIPGGLSVFAHTNIDGYIEFIQTNGIGDTEAQYALATKANRLVIGNDNNIFGHVWEANFNRTNGYFTAPGFAGDGGPLTNTSATLYVSTNGNDATAVRGSVSNPYRTAYAASRAARPTDTIKLQVGVFNETNSIRVPRKCTLMGMGTNSILCGYWNLSAPGTSLNEDAPGGGVFVLLSDESLVSDLTILDGLMGSTNYFGPIGVSFLNTNYENYPNHPVLTSATIRNCTIIGGTDGLFLRSTNLCNVLVDTCIITSRWDCITYFSGPKSVTVLNSFISSESPNTIPGSTNLANCISMNSDWSGFNGADVFYAENSVFYSKSPDANTGTILLASTITKPASVTFKDCVLTSPVSSNAFNLYDRNIQKVYLINTRTNLPFYDDQALEFGYLSPVLREGMSMTNVHDAQTLVGISLPLVLTNYGGIPFIRSNQWSLTSSNFGDGGILHRGVGILNTNGFGYAGGDPYWSKVRFSIDMTGTLAANQIDVAETYTADWAGSGNALTFDDEAYGPGWNGDTTAPTKNAVYDKIETMSGGGSGIPTLNGNGTNTTLYFNNAVWGTNNSMPAGGTPSANLVAGGAYNVLGQNGTGNVMAGGYGNSFGSTVVGGIISGGYSNSIQAGKFNGNISGGQFNNLDASYSAISGGESNTINGGLAGLIAGGSGNRIGTDPQLVTANYGTIGGGALNVIVGAGTPKTNDYTTISGGFSNRASGAYSAVPGGNQNQASGSNSFAAGFRARALHPGSFVWADVSSATAFSSSANNEFAVRATGGVKISDTIFSNSKLVVTNGYVVDPSAILYSPSITTAASNAIFTNYANSVSGELFTLSTATGFITNLNAGTFRLRCSIGVGGAAFGDSILGFQSNATVVAHFAGFISTGRGTSGETILTLPANTGLAVAGVSMNSGSMTNVTFTVVQIR